MWVYFMTTWTPQTPAELAMMQDYSKLLGTEMNELVIDVGEDPATVQTFIKDQGFKLPVGVDQDGAHRPRGARTRCRSITSSTRTAWSRDRLRGAPPDIFIQAITDVVPDFSAEAPTPVPSIPLGFRAIRRRPAETASPAQ